MTQEHISDVAPGLAAVRQIGRALQRSVSVLQSLWYQPLTYLLAATMGYA